MRLGAYLLLLTLALPGFCSVAADEPNELRVLSYNIHHGEGMDHRPDLARIARVILSVAPDIVLLQEVDRNVDRSEHQDQPTELALLTKMNVVFGPNIAFDGGDYGNAVLSRFPIVQHKNHLLPQVGNSEQRGVIEAEIDVPGLPESLIVLATHLDFRADDRERLAAVQVINELAEKHGDRLAILGGDLNDVPDSKTLTALQGSWHLANATPLPTVPVDEPARQIDYVLVRPSSNWKVIDVKVLPESVASDHRPILATLKPAAAADPRPRRRISDE